MNFVDEILTFDPNWPRSFKIWQIYIINSHFLFFFKDEEAPTGTLLERDEKISNEDESPTGTEGDEESLKLEDQSPTGIELKDEETVKEDDSLAGTNGDLGASDEMNKLAGKSPY